MEMRFWATFPVCLVFAGQCFAATLQPMGGEVFVNQGRGYQLVTTPIDINPGDAVMVNPNGLATIVYNGACSVGVKPGLVATVTPNPPCGDPLPPEVAQSYAQSSPPPPSNDFGALGWAGVGLGAAGLGVALYALSQHNSNTTVNGQSCGGPANPCYYAISP
jgi:hypothetical protein